MFAPRNPTPRQQAFIDLALKLGATVAPHTHSSDQAGELAPSSVAALRQSGFLTLATSPRFGGAGANLLEWVWAQVHLAQHDAALALVAAMNAHVLGSATQASLWPEALLEKISTAVAGGALVNAVASEPDLGSPSRGGPMQSRATPNASGWHLRGHKTWATGGRHIDWWVVTASVDNTDHMKFLVPNHAPQATLRPTWSGALAMRASEAHDVVFDAIVPNDHAMVKQPDEGGVANAWFWAAMGATYLGVGLAALRDFEAFAKARTPSALGAPIATLPKVQHAIGDMALRLHQALLCLLEACERFRDGESNTAPFFASAKLACTNAAIHATDVALRQAGGQSLLVTSPLERHFRNARAGLAHPPSDDTALGMLGAARLAGTL